MEPNTQIYGLNEFKVTFPNFYKIILIFVHNYIKLIYFYSIRECGSTLYVGLARTAPPNSTNFRLTFLINQLQEALYEDHCIEHQS